MTSSVIVKSLNNPQAPKLRARYCTSFLSRLRGFTFRKNLTLYESLILVEKNDSRIDTSIHMLFVWTDLAVFWVNSKMEVVDKTVAKNWRPFYASKSPAQYVIEAHPSRINDFNVGEKLSFEKI